MKTRLSQILDRCLNGREAAIWGNPTRPLLRSLEPYKCHIATAVDPQKHYVVAVDEADYSDFEQDPQSEPYEFVKDCTIFNDPGGELPFEWECHGVKVAGRHILARGWPGPAKTDSLKASGISHP